jgi:triosephosphate isomerase
VLIAGNWKMFKGPGEAVAFVAALRDRVGGLDGVDIAVCPTYAALSPVVRALDGTGISVYAQNVHWAPEGAFTGEVSAATLLELGVTGSIVGHSERRQLFGETDETTAMRAAAGLAAGLRVIACVGETEAERDAGETEEVVRRQTEAIRDAVSTTDGLTLAYEPVWAIGTGKTATPAMAQHAHAAIRAVLDVPILYGGSVKPDNAMELCGQPDVDGALVGGASLVVDSFAAICEAAARVP